MFSEAGRSYGVVAGGLKWGSGGNTLTGVSGVFTRTADVVLKLKKNILSGGTYYRFKLSVTDMDGVSASNVYEIKTNRVPSTGKYSQIGGFNH